MSCRIVTISKIQRVIFFIFSEKEVNTLRRQIVNNKTKKANLKTGVSRKQSASNFPKKKHFSPPDMHMYVCLSKGKRYLFFGKFGVLYFLETPFRDSPFQGFSQALFDDVYVIFPIHANSPIRLGVFSKLLSTEEKQ